MFKKLRILTLLTIVVEFRFAHGASIKLIGPRCSSSIDEEKESLNCGSSLRPNIEGGTITLGNLCSDEEKLKIGILREDVDVEGKYCAKSKKTLCLKYLKSLKFCRYVLTFQTFYHLIFFSFQLKSRGIFV